ncbi:hypothetical protein ASD11_07965 [Aeromicrobium sp. Root495]|uniref:LysM peptidoglycan-binding domain-containing protein n=1 Tax=Aeromicrobium sp. Root495 TaxID=1736550 RepID=UPI0006F2F248|nr:LysM domain-containing protein [Aeromicrobium sp. Root495]KQY59488.1 hypothetical protein ASD11_07965 [Aeromicrobium sp. Root495]RYI98666.1 MAG: LysM domain-containing protein [Actinomycetales bacterium]
MSTISFSSQYSFSTPARPQLRLTRRGRLAIVLAVLAAVAVLAVAFGPSTFAGRDAGQLPPVSTVTVQPGDTLWDIAVKANPGGEVRSTIDDILKLNSLSSVSDVDLGDKLAVPVYTR